MKANALAEARCRMAILSSPNIEGLLMLLQWQGCASSRTMVWLGHGELRPLYVSELSVAGMAVPMQNNARWLWWLSLCREMWGGCCAGISSLVQGAHLSLSCNDRWRKGWRSLFLHNPPPPKGVFWQVWLFHMDIKKLCFISFPSLSKVLNTLVCQKTALL